MTEPMITRLNPADLHATPGYAHVTVVPAGRMAFLAGQVPLDSAGRLAGVGLDTQVDQVVANTLAALAAVGAGPGHVVRTVIYVVSDRSAELAGVWRRLLASPLAPAFSTASTLLGVAALGFAGQLVELDVTAALPAGTAAEPTSSIGEPTSSIGEPATSVGGAAANSANDGEPEANSV